MKLNLSVLQAEECLCDMKILIHDKKKTILNAPRLSIIFVLFTLFINVSTDNNIIVMVRI